MTSLRQRISNPQSTFLPDKSSQTPFPFNTVPTTSINSSPPSNTVINQSFTNPSPSVPPPSTPTFHDSKDSLADLEHLNFSTLDDDEEQDFFFRSQETVVLNSRRSEITLLKILNEIDAPLYAFEVIMDWARDAFCSGYKFNPVQRTYQTQISHLQQLLFMENLRPTSVLVNLPGKRTDDSIHVTTFDFISQFINLLSDPQLNSPPNLQVNPADPFSCYQPPDGRLNESLSGSWYKNAWDYMEEHTQCNFMIPIILYIDKTVLSISGKLTIYPVQMSLSIFTEEARRSSRAWRPLGYIANEEYFYSKAERNVNTPDIKNQRLHVQLNAILKSFKDAQAPGALQDVGIQLGNVSKRVNLYVPLQFIIGDAEGGDQLCSRYENRRMNCPRLCRTCDVSTENSARTDIQCQRIQLSQVTQLLSDNDLEGLKLLQQRPVLNSLFDIDCGNDPYGVFSMVHTEGLHALEMGLIPYMLEILLSEMEPRHHRRLDDLVKSLTKTPRQHGFQGFPRLLWNDGCTDLTYLTGDLKVGKMFAISCVASTLEGEIFFTEVLSGGASTWRKMMYVFQQILCYWSWLKQDTFWMCNDIDSCNKATASIKIMMRQLQSLWPRHAGFEWNLTKLHEQFHVPFDIHRHGKHKNVHSGPQEHNHIPTKLAANHTQKNKSKLDLQTGERVIDRLVVQCAYDRVVPQHNNKPQQSHDSSSYQIPSVSIAQSSKGTFHFQTQHADSQFATVDAHCSWRKEKHNGLVPLMCSDILSFLGKELFVEYSTLSSPLNDNLFLTLDIEFYTEYQRNGFVYRSHPLYRGEHPYYDFAYIKWSMGSDPVTQEEIIESIIARILCFFRHPSGELMAVIHSCDMETGEQHGVFGTCWKMELEGPTASCKPSLSMVSVDCIEDHVCMIPYSANHPHVWVHIWPQSQWPGCFQQIEAPDS